MGVEGEYLAAPGVPPPHPAMQFSDFIPYRRATMVQ